MTSAGLLVIIGGVVLAILLPYDCYTLGGLAVLAAPHLPRMGRFCSGIGAAGRWAIFAGATSVGLALLFVGRVGHGRGAIT